MTDVLAISDQHHPFAHRDTFAFLKEVKRKHKPGRVVCMGDEADMYGLSDYDHDPDAPSAGDEYEATMDEMRKLYAIFPHAQSCVSNHTARPYRQAIKHGIPSVYLRSYKEFMCAPPGWSWHEAVEIDGVRYFHGEGYSGPLGALKAAQTFMQPVVIGHLHSYAGVLFNANPKHLFFGMNVGCLIDRDKIAFHYGKHMSAKPILGVGLVRDGIPTFLPMTLSRDGRWNGEV